MKRDANVAEHQNGTPAPLRFNEVADVTMEMDEGLNTYARLMDCIEDENFEDANVVFAELSTLMSDVGRFIKSKVNN